MSDSVRASRVPAKSDLEVALVANSIRHDIIDMLEQSKSGHPGGSLSVTDILSVLYFSGVMDYDPTDPEWDGRDHLILSKGHAAPALYAVYHQLGWIDDEDLMTLRQLGSKLQGHPDKHALVGLDVCSGSLGQGLSVACGEALGFGWDAEKDGTRPRHVWCVMGDGELQEGSNWESFMFAAHKRLGNLTAVIDLNNLQIDGHVTDVNSLGDLDAKLAAFGWHTVHIDGHDLAAIRTACTKALDYTAGPCAIICDTVKGKGVSFMEDQASWHGSAPNHEQAEEARAELDAARAQILSALDKEVSNG